MMKGWKTWVGVILVAISAGLIAAGYEDIAKVVVTIGAGFGLVGLGHKLEKK